MAPVFTQAPIQLDNLHTHVDEVRGGYSSMLTLISTLKSEIYTSRYYLKIQFLLHSEHTLCPLHRPACSYSQKNNLSFCKCIRHTNKLCGHKAHIVMLKKGVPKWFNERKHERNNGKREEGKKDIREEMKAVSNIYVYYDRFMRSMRFEVIMAVLWSRHSNMWCCVIWY